jgi:hypothetical protein
MCWHLCESNRVAAVPNADAARVLDTTLNVNGTYLTQAPQQTLLA